jgi:hypothetical protein
VLSKLSPMTHMMPEADRLSRAIAHFRPKLNRELPLADRAGNFWAITVAVRDLATADVLRVELTGLAHSTGLLRDLGRHGAEDVEHMIRWGLLDRCPFRQRRGAA